MNRALILGIALFLAIVGLALVSAEKTAVAGHGCSGGKFTSGKSCCGTASKCVGRQRCGGRQRCTGRQKCTGRIGKCSGRDRCSGRSRKCTGRVRNRCCGCTGGKGGPAQKMASTGGVSYRQPIFRR